MAQFHPLEQGRTILFRYKRAARSLSCRQLTLRDSTNQDSTTGKLREHDLATKADKFSFQSEAVPGTLPQGQNSPRNVRFGLYAEQMTASAFVAPRHLNKKAWLYRARPSVAHQGFVSCNDFY